MTIIRMANNVLRCKEHIVTLKRTCLVALLVLPFARSAETPNADEFTPVVASPLSSGTIAFPGTDGKQHIVYELLITNTLPTPATLKRIEVIDSGKPSAPLARYEGTQLLSHLRALDNSEATGPDIEFNGTRLFLIDLAFDSRPLVPGQVRHRIGVLAAPMPGHQKRPPVPLSYRIAPFRSEADSKAAAGLEGNWSKSLFVKGSPRQKEFPVDRAIVDFAPGDSGLPQRSPQ
jgi:hypothetical protein